MSDVENKEQIEFWQIELQAARQAHDVDAEVHAAEALKNLGVTV